MADAPGGLVEDFPQHGGVPAQSKRWTHPVNHVFQKLGNLPAFRGLGLRLQAFIIVGGFRGDGPLAGVLLFVKHPSGNRQASNEGGGNAVPTAKANILRLAKRRKR